MSEGAPIPNMRSSEAIWSKIYEKCLVLGARVHIEQEGQTTVSLPLSRDELSHTELLSDGRLQICYREPMEGERRFMIIPTRRDTPVVNEDRSSVSFVNTVIKDPNNLETPELLRQAITIQAHPENNVERPPFLYHGTVDGNITEFTPRDAKERPDEQKNVYATPDIRVAKLSMANRFVSNGGIVNGKYYVCIPMTKAEFQHQDNGGFVYKLPVDGFGINDGRGLGNLEWASPNPVVPLGKKYYGSLEQELIRLGIHIYYIAAEEIPTITALMDQDEPIKLENYLENLDQQSKK